MMLGLVGALVGGLLSMVLAPWFGIEPEGAPLFWAVCCVMGGLVGMIWGVSLGL